MFVQALGAQSLAPGGKLGLSKRRDSLELRVEASWQRPVGKAVRALAVRGSTLIAGTDLTGNLIAIDLPTGRELWRAVLPTSIHNTPIIADSIVVVTYGDLPMPTSPGGAWAFDLKNGHVMWKYETRGATMPAPLLIDEVLVLASSDNCVHGVGLHDGRRVYRACIDKASVMSNPVRNGDIVFFGTLDGKLVSFNGRTGATLWIRPMPPIEHAADATAAVGEDLVFITGTRWGGPRLMFRDTSFSVASRSVLTYAYQTSWKDRHRFFSQQYTAALSQSDGDVRWMTRIGTAPAVLRNQAGSPVLVRDRVVVSSPVASTLTALESTTGKMIWQVHLPSRHRGAATILGDTVLVGLESGELAAYALSNGSLVGNCQWPGAFTPTSPLIVGQTFVYGAADGVLRAVPMRTISLRLRQHGPCA